MLPPRLPVAPKVALPFYQSAEWRALREKRRGDPDYARGCAKCGSKYRLILDHVVEIRDGGAKLDPANTQWLCASHHGEKTQAEKQRRAGLR